MAVESMLRIAVCYIGTEQQFVHAMQVRDGCTVGQALQESGVYQAVPGLDPATIKVGIFSKFKTLDAVLRDHDRIEIYRPLLVDPMNARRARVRKKR